MKYPKISIVMPVFNEEEKIGACLKSIREQNYPQNKIEIVLVDDDSTDKTIEIARKYRVTLARNGKHDYDIGKSIGIKKAKGEYIMFLDGDNILPEKNWIKKIMRPLIEDPTIVGSHPLWHTHNRKDKLFDRYCTLYGISDPLTIYLEKTDRLMLWKRKWTLGLLKETEGYFVAEFNKENLPTIGSVGFTIKKSLLLKTNYDPAFSHLDCVQDLVAQGYKRFALTKAEIIHLHSRSFSDFLGKLKRNLNIFIRDFDKRRYRWDAPLGKKIYAVVAMTTFVIPAYHSLRGYFYIRDSAWLIHPFVCFAVIMAYSKTLLAWKLRRFFK